MPMARIAHQGLHADETTRTYRLLFGTAVALAAIGAPLFMTGAVALAAGIPDPTDPASFVRQLVIFAAYALPMLSAWIAWAAARRFEHAFGAHL